jgi:hypothetical protein
LSEARALQISTPRLEHPKLSFFGQNTLALCLELECGGWDPHPSLPVKIWSEYAHNARIYHHQPTLSMSLLTLYEV